MYLTSEKKAELFAKYGKDKDFGTERALTALVGKRRRMLDYLKAKDIERYRAIIKELGIRK